MTTAMVIFTDLDGTLLDRTTYSFDTARNALAELRQRKIPLILVSSKTRAEIEPIRVQLENDHPFIVENGGAVVIPDDYFTFPLNEAVDRHGDEVIELGRPYSQLRRALKDIQQFLGKELRGYGDMSVDEVVSRTGLSQEEARLSMQREYDEPFVMEGSDDRLIREVKKRGLRYTKGGRFHHLMGPHDKGRAVRQLIDCYRRSIGEGHGGPMTVAIGDSLNDLPMLEAVDRPILVQLTDGSYEPGIEIPRLTLAPGPGPTGWNIAVHALLQE
ncbi:MAG TPA: HAD-IIB family hydrolase [Nitrospira sp.]